MRLLPGERLEARLRPHPLAWMPRYLMAGFPALLGVALALTFRTEWWQTADTGKWYQVWTFLYGNTGAAFVYMFAALAAVGAAISVAAIRWRVFFAYLAIGALVLGLSFATDWAATTDIPVLLVLASVPMLVGAELDRGSHEYHITNLRILFSGGLVVRRDRRLKFESITDLDGSQGLLGRMLDFGTLIPVTQSGFGLGADSSEANIMVGGGAQKGGVAGGLAVGAGGGKEVNTARAKSFHQLTGVRPYGETRYLLERLIQEATSTPYLREQVELQRQMVDALRGQQDEPPLYEGKRFQP